MSERDLFITGLQISDPSERFAWLDRACGGHAALRRRIDVLMQAFDKAGSLLESPAPAPVATVDEPITERPGTVIGPYKLMEQIGEGGMGLVFVAEQQHPVRRKVALKVIKPGMDTRQVVGRFEAERQALALMDHPNIAKVHDGGETASGRPYFVMELVKGVPITEYCDQNQVPIRERLELFLSVCQAVQHAHQKGIIHRDIKPTNVLVASHDGVPVVKIIDFGVAKAVGQHLTDKTVYTQFAQLVGTPLYMSPEQAGLSALDVDTRSDVYSLGVLLYELLTGTTPFQKERFKQADYDEIRRIIREEEPPKPSTRISTLGVAATTISSQRKIQPKRLSQVCRGELDWIVMKALEKDRNRRYESASTFAADVKHYLHDEPVYAFPPSAWYKLHKFARRQKQALAMGVCVVLALAGIAAGIGWTVRDRGLRRVAVEERARVALEEATRLAEGEKWPEALNVARRAQGLLAGVGADLSLVQQVEELARNLEMVRHLDESRLTRTVVFQDARFEAAETHRDCAKAFAWYGLDIEHLDPPEAAERIRSRLIRSELVAALTEWAIAQRILGLEGWRQLAAVALAAEPEHWRGRLHEAVAGNDPNAARLATGSPLGDDLPPAAVVLLGRKLLRNGAPERAVLLLQSARQRHPDDFWLNIRLGATLFAQFKWKEPAQLAEAIGFLRAAVALRPHSPGARLNLASALRSHGKHAEAEAECRILLDSDPNYAEAHVLLGNALNAQGKHDAAIVEYRIALGLRPDYALAYYNLGLALRRQKKQTEAEAAYREALRLRPHYPEAHGNLGNVLVSLGRPEEAIAEFQTALQQRPDYPEAAYFLGLTLGNQGKHAEAEAAFREAVRLRPSYGDAHNGLLVALNKQGKHAAVAAAFRMAARWLPEDPQTGHRYHAARAAALAGCGQGQDAAGLDAMRRARLRRQALDWLRADLEAWDKLLDEQADKARPAVIDRIQHWLPHPDFAGVRGDDALVKLPASERRAWQRLWADVAEMLARAEGK